MATVSALRSGTDGTHYFVIRIMMKASMKITASRAARRAMGRRDAKK